MINIYKVVRKVYEANKDRWNDSKAEGFKECLMLFLVGIEKHVAFNCHIELEETKKLLRETQYNLKNLKSFIDTKELKEAKSEIDNLKKQLRERPTIEKIVIKASYQSKDESYLDFIRSNNLLDEYSKHNRDKKKLNKTK